jgi:copper chaperone CopZ
MSMTTSYTVLGMTCDHCVRAVTSELEKVPAVERVSVDLPSGAVTVTSAAPVADDVIRDAVEEAGYEVRP